MADPSISERILRYLCDEFGLPADLTAESPLFSSGLLSSTEVLRLVLFLEQSFGVTIPSSDITEAHFDTVSRIADYLSSRVAAPS